MKGKTQSDYQKSMVSQNRSKTWVITKPDGSTEIITNLRQYCISNDLSSSNIATNSGSKGYKAILYKI